MLLPLVMMSYFTGATANVTWDKSEDDLVFPDNARAKFGTDLDLHIYHNGSNSVIREEGTGNLNIQTTGGNVDILVNTTETAAKFISDGAVELYHNDTKRFETTTTGINVTGNIGVGDATADYELEIYADSPQIRLEETGSGGSKRLDLWVTNSGQAYIGSNQSASSLIFQTTGSNALTLSSTQNATFAGSVSDSKGDVRKIIETVHSSAHTLVSADAGKVINISTGGVTIAANVFVDGDAVTIVNNSGSNQTITTSAVSMYLAGTTSLKTSLTLSGRGMATFICMGGNVFYGSGGGLS